MKINEGKGIILSRDRTETRPGKSLDGEFQKIMEQVARAGDNPKAVEPNIIDPLLNGIKISPVNQIDNQSHPTERQLVINELQETMDLVDFYAAKLADPSRPLSTIDPLIGHLEQRMENLKAMESTPGLPDKLKPIVSDMVITIGAEITRYKSGNYS